MKVTSREGRPALSLFSASFLPKLYRKFSLETIIFKYNINTEKQTPTPMGKGLCNVWFCLLKLSTSFQWFKLMIPQLYGGANDTHLAEIDFGF